MVDRPILFSGPMVRALLAGTKTQTRRAVKITHRTPGLAACLLPADPAWVRPKVAAELCPYGQPGDRLWVRETFCTLDRDHYFDPGMSREFIRLHGGVPRRNGAAYRADGEDSEGERCRKELGYRWTPSIHMPRWASRITLEITDVRVERLCSISEADAIAEGLKVFDRGNGVRQFVFPDSGYDRSKLCHGDAGIAYLEGWNEINGAGSSDADPWVWAISFKRVAA